MIMLSELIPICEILYKQHGNLLCTSSKGRHIAPPEFRIGKPSVVCLSCDVRYRLGIKDFIIMLRMIRSEVTMDLPVTNVVRHELLEPKFSACYRRIEFECK